MIHRTAFNEIFSNIFKKRDWYVVIRGVGSDLNGITFIEPVANKYMRNLTLSGIEFTYHILENITWSKCVEQCKVLSKTDDIGSGNILVTYENALLSDVYPVPICCIGMRGIFDGKYITMVTNWFKYMEVLKDRYLLGVDATSILDSLEPLSKYAALVVAISKRELSKNVLYHLTKFCDFPRPLEDLKYKDLIDVDYLIYGNLFKWFGGMT